jgi:DNA-binding NtrC family response regulator
MRPGGLRSHARRPARVGEAEEGGPFRGAALVVGGDLQLVPRADRLREARLDAVLTPGTTVEEAERRIILHTRDNTTRAAEILGIILKPLHNKLNRLRGRAGGRREASESAPQR